MPADLDQFFTRKVIAWRCWRALQPVLAKLCGTSDLFFVEPAAGDGVFYDLLPEERRLGIDIAPRRREFVRGDFLKRRRRVCAYPKNQIVVVGNPPFGTRGKTAVEFFHSAMRIADTVAFIVPVIFRKYFIHKQMPEEWRWVFAKPLPRDSFYTPDGKRVSVNTEFQVWTKYANTYASMRLTTPPPIYHNDFRMWQYNNTLDARKFFNEPFEFAVPCQGWQDYTRRETKAQNCEMHKQWMLFAPANPRARRRLCNDIDYEALALANTTSIPGFRKGDIVMEYMRRYG